VCSLLRVSTIPSIDCKIHHRVCSDPLTSALLAQLNPIPGPHTPLLQQPPSYYQPIRRHVHLRWDFPTKDVCSVLIFETSRSPKPYRHKQINIKGKVKKIKLTYSRPWRPTGGVQVCLYSFFNPGVSWGWVVNATPRPCNPREWADIKCMGSRTGLEIYGKSHRYRDSDSVPSSP